MKRINNVDTDNIRNFADQIKADPSKARKTQVIEGEWVTEEGSVQFRSHIKFEGGEVVFEADSPTFMGGTGTLPGPMQYCFFGLASCYTGIFATIASLMGVKIKSLKTRVEADINFSQVFGIEEKPIMEEVRVTLHVISDSPAEKIKEIEELAIKRCPAVYTLRNIVRFTPRIEISQG